jgi:molybdopterin-guanine dinucleotide biosynthesis protein B
MVARLTQSKSRILRSPIFKVIYRYYECNMTIPIITIIGRSGSGKTTLMEKLIAELTRRGYQVATIKHHSHAGFDIDRPGKDSWRHAKAGSVHVVVAAPDKIASYRLLEQELSLDEIIASIDNVDIILAEGYRQAGKPTLEIVRAETGTGLVSPPEQLFAVTSDISMEVEVPLFDLEEFNAMVDLIENLFLSE